MAKLLALSLLCWCFYSSQALNEWINHGGDLGNRRFAACEEKISTQTAPRLTQKWRFVAGSDVAATPSVYEGLVYFPSRNGGAYAVDLKGRLVWKVNLTSVTGFAGAYSRAAPTMTDCLAIFSISGPAIVVALERRTGDLVWKSDLLDQRPDTIVTMSGTAFKGGFYIGVSSAQEVTENCCTFQGSFQKLDLCTGKRIWRTSMVPANRSSKFTGAAVWGSSPPIDKNRGLVYIATGNLYTVPDDVQACIDANQTECIPADILDESVIAIDITNGHIRWFSKLGRNDVFRLIPGIQGPDYDFGEAPMFVTVPTSKPDLVVTGQKSGVVWAHDRSTGQIVWETAAGPGGYLGGAIWGSATDNSRVYTNIANSQGRVFVLEPSKETTTSGGWVAMDAATGKIIWSTANPTGGVAFGPVTVTKGNVLLVTSFDPQGHVFALDARDGSVLWSATTGSTVYGGFSAAYGCAFVGTGYRFPNLPATPGDSLSAFCAL